ncbi:unnamed protein product, partial [Meganyctiphanes norvegica]
MSGKLPVTCIYWQQGRCFKDERSCRFIHGTICRYDPCKREDCDRVHLKHGRDRDRGYGGRQDSRYHKSPNRYQNDRRYNRSPKRYRSKSPRGNRSPQRYRSPSNRQGSRSPNPKRYGSRSPNPKKYDSRSPNPKKYDSRSPNPKRYDSISPNPKRYYSRSPNPKRYESKSPNPVRYSRSQSPVSKLQRSKSPNAKRYASRSPNPLKYRSESPNPKRFSRSPNSKRYSRSPTTKKYSRSPNPKSYGSQSPNHKRYGSRSPNPEGFDRNGSRSPITHRYGRSLSPKNRRSQSPLHNRSFSPNQRQRHDSGHKSSASPRRERSPTPKKKKRRSPKLLASPSPERHGSDSTVHEHSPPIEKYSISKWKKVERSPSETREKSSSPENQRRSRSHSPMSPQTRNIQSDEEYERSRSSSKNERKYKKRDGSPNEGRDKSPIYTRNSKEDGEEKEELSTKNSSWSSKPADISSELRNLVASLSNSKFAELSKALEIRDKISGGNMKKHEKIVSTVEGLEEIGEEVEGIFDSEEHEEKEKPDRNREVEDGVNPSPPHHSHTSSRNSKREVDIAYKSDWDLKSAIENPSQPMEKLKPPPVKINTGGKGELWTPALDRRREAKAQMHYESKGTSNIWEVETPYVSRDSKRKSASEDAKSTDVSDKSMAPPKIAELSSAGKLLSSLMSHGGKLTDIPSSLTQVMPSPIVDSRASIKGQKSAQTIIDELLESRAKDSQKNRQSPSHVDRPAKSGKDIKEMGYEALEKSLSKSSDLVKELLRSKSRSVSPDERISRKSSYDSPSGKTKSKRAKEIKKRKPSTSSSDTSSSDEEGRNIEKEKRTRGNEKKIGKYREDKLESQTSDDLKRQKESLLRKIKLFRGQKSQLNEQKEDVIRNHRGDDESLEHLLEENSALQKEIGKQIMNMTHMLRDIDEQMEDIKEKRTSEKSGRHQRNEEDYYQNDAEEKYRREHKEGNEKYRRESDDKYHKDSEDRYRREANENYRRGEDKYFRESEDRYRRGESPRRESRRDMSPPRRDRRNDSPYYRDDRRSSDRNVYMETEIPHHKRSRSMDQKRSGSPHSPVVTLRHQRSPDRRSQSPPSKRQQTGKEQGIERHPKSRKAAAPEQSASEEDGEDAEEYGPVPSQKQYIRYTDAGMHWCKLCTHFSDSIPDYADHLMSSDHLAKVKADRKTWLGKAPKVEKDIKPPNVEYVTLPVQGVEFIHSMTAFYCSLCDFFMRDKQEMFAHPESKKHINNYKIHQSKNPMYETTYTKAKGTFYAKFKLEEQRKFFEEKRKAKDEARALLKEKESNFERSRRQGSIERLREDTEDYDSKVEKEEFKSYSSIRVASRGSGAKSEAEPTRGSPERTEDEASWSYSSSKKRSSSRLGSTADVGKASITKPLIEPKKIDVKIDADAIVEKDKERHKNRESKSGQQSTKTPFIGKMPFLRRKVGGKDEDDTGSRKSSAKRKDNDKDRSKDDEIDLEKKSKEKAFTDNLEKNLSEFLKNKIEQKKKESESSPAAMSDESDEEIEVIDPRSLIPPSAKPTVPNVTGRRKQMLEAASSGIIKAQDKETKMMEEKIQETKLEEKIKKSSQISPTTTESTNANGSPIPLDIPLPSIMTCMPDPKADNKEDWGNLVMSDIAGIQDHESQATSSLSTGDYNLQLSYGVPPPIMTAMSMMVPAVIPGDCDLSKPPPGINMDMQAIVEGEDIYRPCDMEVEDIMDYKAMTPPPPGTETPPPTGTATPPPPGTTPPRTVTPPPPGTENFLGSKTPPPPGTSPDKSTEYSSNRHTGGPIPRNIPFENKINELKEQSLVLESIFKEAPHFEVATSIFKKPKSSNSSVMDSFGEGNTEEKDDFQREMEELVKHKLKELKGSTEVTADETILEHDSYERSSPMSEVKSTDDISNDEYSDGSKRADVIKRRMEEMVKHKLKELEGSTEDTAEKIRDLDHDSHEQSSPVIEIESSVEIFNEDYTDRSKRVGVVQDLEEEEAEENIESISKESAIEKKSPSGKPRGRGKNTAKIINEMEGDDAPDMENKIRSPARGRRQIPRSTIVKSDTEEDSRDDSPSKPEEVEAKRSVRGRRLPTKFLNEDELEEESLPAEVNTKKSPGRKTHNIRSGIKESEEEEEEEDSVNEAKPKQLPPRSRKPSARAAAAAAVASVLDSDEDEMEEIVKSPRKRGRKPSVRVTTDEGEEDTEDAATTVATPSKRTSRKKTPAIPAIVESVDEEEEDKAVKPTKRTRRQPARSAIVESPEEDELQEETATSNKRSRRTRRP